MLLPFVAGMAVAYFLDPVCDRLQRLGCTRVWATTIVSICFILVLVLAILLILPTLQSQIVSFAQRLPGYLDRLSEHCLARAAEAGGAAGHRKPGRSAQPGQRHGGRHRGLGRRRAGRAGDQRGGAGQSPVAAFHHPGRRLLSAARLGPPEARDRFAAARAPCRHDPPAAGRGRPHAGRLRPRPGHGLPGSGRLLRHRPHFDRRRFRPRRGDRHRRSSPSSPISAASPASSSRSALRWRSSTTGCPSAGWSSSLPAASSWRAMS